LEAVLEAARTAAPRDIVLYFSGHGQANDLWLDGGPIPFQALISSLEESAQGQVQAAFIDACDSHTLSPHKGIGADPGPIHHQPVWSDTSMLLVSNFGTTWELSEEPFGSPLTLSLLPALLRAPDERGADSQQIFDWLVDQQNFFSSPYLPKVSGRAWRGARVDLLDLRAGGSLTLTGSDSTRWRVAVPRGACDPGSAVHDEAQNKTLLLMTQPTSGQVSLPAGEYLVQSIQAGDRVAQTACVTVSARTSAEVHPAASADPGALARLSPPTKGAANPRAGARRPWNYHGRTTRWMAGPEVDSGWRLHTTDPTAPAFGGALGLTVAGSNPRVAVDLRLRGVTDLARPEPNALRGEASFGVDVGVVATPWIRVGVPARIAVGALVLRNEGRSAPMLNIGWDSGLASFFRLTPAFGVNLEAGWRPRWHIVDDGATSLRPDPVRFAASVSIAVTP
jgi:hypothetical protein